MGTTREDIRRWFVRGVEGGAEYMIVVCDQYDWSDYPAYCHHGDFWEKHDGFKRGNNMQQVMEVYDLSLDMDSQLREHRAFHYPPRPETVNS